MDSVTQIVLGAAVGEAILGKRIGNKALFYGAIAGTIPDLDVLVGEFSNTVTALELHRSFSHSLLFCLFLAPVLGVLINKIEKKIGIGWKPWTKLFFWGLFTHAILDAFTSWGTQLFWPLPMRIAFNSIFVVDLLYTLPFLLCTFWLLFYKKDAKKRRSLNILGLVVSSVYLLIAVFLKLAATNQFKKALKEQNISYLKLSTRPSAMNTILWNANIDTPNYYLIGAYSFFDSQPIRFKSYAKQRETSKEIEKHPLVKRLVKISKGWYILENKEGTWYFNDLRFGVIPQKNGTSFFAFSYKLETINGELIATEVKKTKRDAKFLMHRLWNRIQGN